MSTNGTHTVTSSESSTAVYETHSHLDRQSVDERLEALRATIRGWDWRTALVEVGPPPAEQLSTATTSPGGNTSTEVTQGSESLLEGAASQNAVAGARSVEVTTGAESVTAAAPLPQVVLPHDEVAAPPRDDLAVPPAAARTPPASSFAPSDAVDAPMLDDAVVPPMAPSAQSFPPTDEATTQPVEVPAPTWVPWAPHTEMVAASPPTVDRPVTEEVALTASTLAPTAPHVEQPVQETGNEAPGYGGSWFGQEPEPAPEPDGALHRLWSHRWTKLAVAAVAIGIIVVLIVGGIRFFAKNPSSGGTTTTTATRSSSSPPTSHVVAPISGAQLAQYQAIATAFQNANVTATKGFVTAGSTPTASRVVLVVVGYRTAVNLYNYQLHFIQWPQSMQSAIETDHAQLQALSSFLAAFSTVAPTGVPAWLSQLHDRANSTQVADNAVRQDLGLSASASFP